MTSRRCALHGGSCLCFLPVCFTFYYASGRAKSISALQQAATTNRRVKHARSRPSISKNLSATGIIPSTLANRQPGTTQSGRTRAFKCGFMLTAFLSVVSGACGRAAFAGHQDRFVPRPLAPKYRTQTLSTSKSKTPLAVGYRSSKLDERGQKIIAKKGDFIIDSRV